jgi:ABC-2 type transport system permease protein
MFVLLVKMRIQSLWNVAIYTANRHKLVAAGLTLFGILLFIGVFYGFRLFLTLFQGPGGMETLIYEVFFFLFLFLLAGAVPFVASTLLHSHDYLLLSAAPVRPRTIVAAKLLDATVTNSLQFTVIGVPAIVACGSALHLNLIGWGVLSLVVALFVLLPALITAFLLLVALAAFGMRRVRGAITAVNALMALGVCLTIVVQTSQLQLNRGIHGLLANARAASPSAMYGPSGWFADCLIAISQGDLWWSLRNLVGLTALVTLLYAACMALGGRMLSAETLAIDQEGGEVVAVGEMRAHRTGILALFSSPVAALIAKDMRYLMRDSVLLSQLGMPVILFFVPFVLAFQESFQSLGSPMELYPFAAAMVGIIVFMQTSILSLSSIGLESRSFWLILSSPNGGITLVWAKFIMSALVSAGVGLTLSLISAIIFRAPVWLLGAQCVVVVSSAVALCGMGVGISAALPRFVYENPAHRVSAWALIIGFFVTMAYVLLIGVLISATWALAGQSAELAPVFYALGLLLLLIITLFSAILPMAIGAKRIGVYQWEH